MKQLKCEMCGSSDLVKQDGVFVCQSCGCKYSVEEAKKMMVEVEGTVEVKGTVKVDTSDELSNLYQLARSAKENDNRQNAAKYYDMILAKDAMNWEPNFYSAYYKFYLDEYPDANGFRGSVIIVFELISNISLEEKINIIKEILEKVDHVCKFRRDDFDLSEKMGKPYTGSAFAWLVEASSVEVHWGNIYKAVIEHFPEENTDLNTFVVEHIKQFFSSVNIELATSKGKDMILVDYVKKHEPDYTLPSTVANSTTGTPRSTTTSSSGCYVATCVYGSYDCPQVWTLRRFRDNTLAKTMLGRAFIHTYYAISPTLVKWFGNTSWFKNMLKEPLDRMVSKLKSSGVEDTPYEDKI